MRWEGDDDSAPMPASGPDPDEGVLDVDGAQMAIWVPVSGLRSKANFRRRGQSREWTTLSNFATDFAWELRRRRPSGWPLGDRDVPVARRPEIVVAIDVDTVVDCGNVDKSILDAAEGVLYWSDAQVRAELVTTRRVRESSGFAAFAVLDGSQPAKTVVVTLSQCAERVWRHHDGDATANR